MPITIILLAGVVTGSLASPFTTFLMSCSLDGLRRAFNWLPGGYSWADWLAYWVALPYLVIGLIVLQINARALNMLQLDEEQA